MTMLLDTKLVDVKWEDGLLKLEVPAKAIALALLRPQLEKLKAETPELVDVLIDKIVKSIEEA